MWRGTERDSSCSEVHKHRKEDRNKIQKISVTEFRNININGPRVYINERYNPPK